MRKGVDSCERRLSCLGKFSSDRTVSEYPREIWKIKPTVVRNFAHAALLEE